MRSQLTAVLLAGPASTQAINALYRLTLKAKERFESSGLSAREFARLLDTSPAQLYRLLDPTNYTKSVKQLISLLYLLGAEVDVEVKTRPGRRGSRRKVDV
jgi:hypothetical protein